MSYRRSAFIFATAAFVGAGVILFPPSAQSPVVVAPVSQVSSSEAPLSATTSRPEAVAPSRPEATTTAVAAPVKKTNSTATKSDAASATTSGQVSRVKNPYAEQPQPFASLNTSVRASLVNILCLTSESSLRPISGSGVMIDERGVILTNAHVAQYVLLAESGIVNLTCTIRTGSPARPRYVAKILYIPAAWVQAHASEINSSHPVGTGEHDYALLYVTGTTDGTPLPSQFDATPPDAREAIGFLDDQVLVASYPAEFLGGFQAENNLYAASSITSIRQLMTFNTQSVDVISVGGVLEAQSGSSGGAVVNLWDRLIGLITTTSEGATTADRDLHAITLSYIDRDLVAQTGAGLSAALAGDLTSKTASFEATSLSTLAQLFVDHLAR